MGVKSSLCNEISDKIKGSVELQISSNDSLDSEIDLDPKFQNFVSNL